MRKEIPWNLIISRLEQSIGTDDDRLLDEWLSDEKHLRIYEEISALWQKVQKRAENYAPQPALYWEKMARKLDLPSVRKEKKHRLKFKRTYGIAACIAMLVVFSLSFYLGMGWESGKEMSEQCYTNISGRSQAILPDGTAVWLHANTTLTYKIDAEEKNRTVNLEGEAYFEVAKDEEKQFIVRTDGMNIAVYGTKFNVISRPEVEGVNVSLLEGSVAFTTDVTPQKRYLQPGETATYDKKSHKVSIVRDEVAMNVAWASPTVQFSNRSLSQICEVLSKRFDVNIEVAPELGEKYIYTFTLHDENVGEILELMASIHPIKCKYKSDGSIRITK